MTEHATLTYALQRFAPDARDVLAGVAASGGVLEPLEARTVCDLQGLALPELMTSLLPVAAAFSRPGISGFRVGAAACTPPVEDGWGRIYLGGNLEFTGEALGLTIHAEQAVTLNARFGGEPAIAAVAVSSLPCGHCRQFLNEISAPPDVFTVSQDRTGVARHSVEQLLPSAFGPSDLGVEAGLLDQRETAIVVEGADEDSPIVRHALRAARCSYAPYTGAYAGCALRTKQGTFHAGGYIENAAFNPSVLAVQSALLHLHLKGPGLDAEVSELALVEVDGPTTQLAATQRLLDAVAPEAAFTYRRGRSK
jgi:cytidine deaminase